MSEVSCVRSQTWLGIPQQSSLFCHVLCPYLWRKRRKDVNFRDHCLCPCRFLAICFTPVALTSALPWKLTAFNLITAKVDFMGIWELQVSIFSERNLKQRHGVISPVGSHFLLAPWERRASFGLARVFNGGQNAGFHRTVSQGQ